MAKPTCALGSFLCPLFPPHPLHKDSSEEQNPGRGVGFGLGDGYDFGAAAAEALLEAISGKAAAAVAVEANAVEVI